MPALRVHLPYSTENRDRLDQLMELGLINGYENFLDRLAVLDDAVELEGVLKILDEYLPGIDLHTEILPDQDWNVRWRENFKPLAVADSFFVCAPWHREEKVPAGRMRMIINPGQAFGTGTHESTQLVMGLLEKYPPRDGDVIDIGCGSGILSIAAEMLGARSVYAVDYDPVFLDNMQENLELNRMRNIRFETGNVFEMTEFPGSVCLMNIEKHIIKPALKRLHGMGLHFPRLFLSGLLATDLQEVTDFCAALGWKRMEYAEKGEWIGVYLEYEHV